MEQVPKQIGTQLMCAPSGAVVEGQLEEDVAGKVLWLKNL